MSPDSNQLLLLQWSAVIGASLIGAWTDWRTMRIPNRLTGPVFLLGLVWAGCLRGFGGLADSLLGCLIMAGPFVVLFFLGGGAGDAKLMGALGAWLGVQYAVMTLLFILVAGLVWAIGFAIVHKRVGYMLERLKQIAFMFFLFITPHRQYISMSKDSSRGKPVVMPYGLAICTGVCLAAVRTALWS